MDADHRGGWTHIFGGKASEQQISRPVVNAIFACMPALLHSFALRYEWTLLPDLALYQKFAASGKIHWGFWGPQGAECLLGAAPPLPAPLEPSLFCTIKLEYLAGLVERCLRDTCSRFRRTPTRGVVTDRRTDIQTQDDSKYRAGKVSCV